MESSKIKEIGDLSSKLSKLISSLDQKNILPQNMASANQSLNSIKKDLKVMSRGVGHKSGAISARLTRMASKPKNDRKKQERLRGYSNLTKSPFTLMDYLTGNADWVSDKFEYNSRPVEIQVVFKWNSELPEKIFKSLIGFSLEEYQKNPTSLASLSEVNDLMSLISKNQSPTKKIIKAAHQKLISVLNYNLMHEADVSFVLNKMFAAGPLTRRNQIESYHNIYLDIMGVGPSVRSLIKDLYVLGHLKLYRVILAYVETRYCIYSSSKVTPQKMIQQTNFLLGAS